MNRTNRFIPMIVILVIGLAIGFTFAALVLRTGSEPKATDDGSEADHASMLQTMDGMASALKDKKGDAFDHEFLNQMIAHHEGAVAMARSALQSAGHSEIKTLASEIIASQNKEIDKMKEWRQAWYAQ